MRRVNSRSTKEYALKYLNTCSWLEVKNMKYLKPELRDDPEVVTAAVKQNGFALEYASERLKDDPEIVKTAVNNHGLALNYASPRLQDDPEIVKEAVKNHSSLVLQCVSEWMKDDPEIVAAAVEHNGWALEYASKRLQAFGIDGVIELAKEQKRKRQIQRSKIDIKNKKIILEP